MKNKFNEIYSYIEREGKEDLLEHLNKSGYFTAPASSQYHLCRDGGLLEHSLNVVSLMMNLMPVLKQDTPGMKESIAIVGLFHDLGKADYFGKPNYAENILKSGMRSEAKPYETNKTLLGIPHEVSSIHILSQFIKLTEDETFAILYHNGLYTGLGYALKGKETSLQMILHFADMYSSRVIEK